MIEKVFTAKSYPIYSSATSLYKLVAILLILKKMNKVTIGKLQVYLWGLENEVNLNQLKRWKVEKRITDAPWLTEEDFMPIVSQCISNHFVKVETNKSQKTSLLLDLGAETFLRQISDLELTAELNASLEEIGKITDTLLDNIEFDF
ncbi:hypothetical protein [Bacteroides graminisolvens]|uniref:hypothetical protein n=1 Tax=Bacteroides graminisolvens TaxID=477666 RepID=UPI00240A21A0|nr:hypothetical protein [Bacteroides graminisolvens]